MNTKCVKFCKLSPDVSVYTVLVLVLVLDYRSPFVRSAHPYDVVFIREGEQVVIPCLGSVEDINVTLFTVSGTPADDHETSIQP